MSTTRSPWRRVLAVLAAVVVLTTLVTGVSQVKVDTGISSFVPRGDEAYTKLVERDEDFGGDPVVVLLKGASRDGLLVDAQQLIRLVALEGELSRLPDVAVVYGPGTVLNQTATSIRNVLLQIVGRRDGLENTTRARAEAEGKSTTEVEAEVQKALAGFDRRYGALLVEGMPMGLPSLQNRRFVSSVMFGQDGGPRPEWRFLAPTAKSATLLVRPRSGLDQQATQQLVDRVRTTVAEAGLQTEDPVVTGVPVLTSAVADQATREAPIVGAVALAGVGLILFLVPWSRRRRDRLRPLLAVALGTATTLALFGFLDRPLSLGVVAFLPIVLGIGSDFPLYLAQRTDPRRVLTAATGAVLAFAALGLSELPFVREFGLALALGVAATVAWALALRKGLRDVEPATRARPGRHFGARARGVLVAAAAVGALAAAAGWVMLPTTEIESRPQELAQGLPQLADVERAEETLGFSGELSVVVRGPDVLSPEVIRWSREAEQVIAAQHADTLRPLLTVERLLQFLGPDATADQVRAGSSLVPPYLMDAVVGSGGKVASSTYGVQLDDVTEQRDLIEAVQRELPPPPADHEVDVVGLPVVAASGLDAMSASRWLIGLGGLVVAAAAVVVGLRSVRLGLMVAASALLASGWVYLGVQLLGGELNPLTLAVGALITVTACEFTVMLSGRESGHPLGRSVAAAAAAGTVGYLCLALSELAVLRDFGVVLAAGVACSYVASCVVVALGAEGRKHIRATPTGTADAPSTHEEALTCH